MGMGKWDRDRDWNWAGTPTEGENVPMTGALFSTNTGGHRMRELHAPCKVSAWQITWALFFAWHGVVRCNGVRLCHGKVCCFFSIVK